MNIQALPAIESFTITALLATAAICLVSVLIAWYTVRSRIQFSQIILGVFAYVLVMLLENVFNMISATAGLPTSGMVYALYLTLSIVLSREIVRIVVMKFGLLDRFNDTDAALGFAIGFAGLYLFVCASYYFNLYTAAKEVAENGVEAFLMNAGTDQEEAYALLEAITSQTGWEYIFTGLNRAFFLVRELAFSVLVWYGLGKEKMRYYLVLVPVMHFITMLPDSIYGGGLMDSLYLKDVITFILTGGVIFLAATTYNKHEDQATHYEVEKLRARKRK